MSLPKISGSGVKLKVTPEQLILKADEVLEDVNTMKTCIDTIQEKVDGTKGYWIGEAGELHRNLYYNQKENIDLIMRRLDEHPKDLKVIAGKYTAVEKEVEGIANALTDNVIV